MKYLLVYLDNKKLKIIHNDYLPLLLKCNVLSPSEYIIISPDGEIKDSRISSLCFLNLIFLQLGDNSNES